MARERGADDGIDLTVTAAATHQLQGLQMPSCSGVVAEFDIAAGSHVQQVFSYFSAGAAAAAAATGRRRRRRRLAQDPIDFGQCAVQLVQRCGVVPEIMAMRSISIKEHETETW